MVPLRAGQSAGRRRWRRRR